MEQKQEAEYRPGDSVAGYLRVEALLGQGGAGSVYRVRNERKGGRLALKQLHVANHEHKDLLTTQFAREYHTLSQLAHPRIIEVYDYGIDRGCLYYTMELLDGQDLHDRGKLPYRTACALLCDVASSLSMLHARGLIHRDVSARNVRCTGDGKAKLLDFGAMVAAGSVQRAVGTPPFVAPEVLQMQALDARADLYGLGALAYWTLTGRHAYPAQTFHQLRDVWRRAPPKVSELVKEVPEALSELVISLLRLDREERPRSAAEVMERLSGIAGLPREELPQVGRAYLMTPRLVGRAGPLHAARAALVQTLQTGHGAALLIEGPAGVGRSRFLDACVLEAKLLGAVVLRGTAADASQGDYGVVRALLAQFVDACPHLSEQAAQPRAALLVHVLPALAPQVAKGGKPERRHVQAALRDFFLSVTRSKHVVVAVDDVAAIDEPSAALLCALAHGTQRRRLSLLLTAGTESSVSQSVTVMREFAQRVELSAFDVGETEELLGSLFGDSPQIGALAWRLHAVSNGLARELMREAEHLVRTGLVRYEAGSWALPLELRDEDLAKSDADTLRRRVAGLSSDARELGEALSLTEVRNLSIEHYTRLTGHNDSGRTFAALEELVRAGILVAEADRYRLTVSDVLAPLSAGLAAEQARALHARLAQVLPVEHRSGERLRHLLRGGQEQQAIEALLSGPPDELYPGRLDALVEAAEAVDRLGLPVRTQLELQYRIGRLSSLMARPELFERYGWPLIERLRKESGFLDYHELDAGLAQEARMAAAVRQAQARYEAKAELERGFGPQESMSRLIAMHGSCNGLAGQAYDIDQLDRLGSLEPWTTQSRAIALGQTIVDYTRAGLSGRFDVCERMQVSMFEQLSQPEGLHPSTVKTLRLILVYEKARLLAFAGDASCEAWIKELDTEPGHRGNAWRCRMLYRLALGEYERAQEYERRAGLLDLQDSGIVARGGDAAAAELYLHVYADNLTGLKRAGERVSKLARTFPAWRASETACRAQLLRLQGDAAGALIALQPALEGAVLGRHPDWTLVRWTQLQLLLGLGRPQEAATLGLHYLDESPTATADGLGTSVAVALAQVGRLEDAKRIADECLAVRHAAGTRGVGLGLAYEARGYVAIAMGDVAMFKSCAEHCAELYLRGRSPGLVARYERMQEAAAAAGLIARQSATRSDADEAPALGSDEARTVYSRMLTCVSPVERAERGLQLVIEATGAHTGYFFGLRAGKLELLFNPEPDAPAAGLRDMLEDCLERELGGFRGEPPADRSSLVPRAIAAPIERFLDDLGREFEPLVLAGEAGGESMIAGVVALHYPEDDRPEPRRAMLDALIEALIAEDVVDPITCVT